MTGIGHRMPRLQWRAGRSGRDRGAWRGRPGVFARETGSRRMNRHSFGVLDGSASDEGRAKRAASLEPRDVASWCMEAGR